MVIEVGIMAEISSTEETIVTIMVCVTTSIEDIITGVTTITAHTIIIIHKTIVHAASEINNGVHLRVLWV